MYDAYGLEFSDLSIKLGDTMRIELQDLDDMSSFNSEIKNWAKVYLEKEKNLMNLIKENKELLAQKDKLISNFNQKFNAILEQHLDRAEHFTNMNINHLTSESISSK